MSLYIHLLDGAADEPPAAAPSSPGAGDKAAAASGAAAGAGAQTTVTALQQGNKMSFLSEAGALMRRVSSIHVGSFEKKRSTGGMKTRLQRITEGLAVPFTGVVDARHDDTQPEVVYDGIAKIVVSHLEKRKNYLLINEGSPNVSDKSVFVADILKVVMPQVVPVCEAALQVLADEIAKEKQLQQLMSAEDSASPHGARRKTKERTAFSEGDASMSSNAQPKQPVPPLGTNLRPQSGRPLSSRPGTAPHRTRSRFELISADVPQPVVPPLIPNMLECRALTDRPFSASGSGRTAVRFDARPNTARGAGSGPEQRRASVQERRRSQMQRPSLKMFSDLNLGTPNASPTKPLRNNGWGETLKYPFFDGTKSLVALPQLHNVTELVKSFSLDFWIKTEMHMSDGKSTLFHVGEGSRLEVGMLLHIGMNWYEDTESIRLLLRDAGNRVLEVAASIPESVLDNDFHHVRIHVVDSQEGLVQFYFDGRLSDRMRFLQSEHPSQFNKFSHRFYVGGYLSDDGSLATGFCGSIIQLRLSHGQTGHVLARWPLSAPPEANILAECMGAYSAEPSVVREVKFQSMEPPPQVVPVFDGESTLVNLGSQGQFGNFMHQSGIEVRFRTAVANKVMCLVGVVDSQRKKQELCIMLNAEPVRGRADRFKFHEHSVTFFVMDCEGRSLCSFFRGNERNSVCDGKWHSLNWKIVDSETNRMEARVDGVNLDMQMVFRDGPKNFVPFQDWICLGGVNVRGLRCDSTFVGNIKACTFFIRGEKWSEVVLAEGPGATVSQDTTGRGHDGIYVVPTLWKDKATTAKEKNAMPAKSAPRDCMFWVPRVDNATAQQDTAEAETEKIQVVRYRRNNVRFAVLRFHFVWHHPDGVVEEVTDAIAGKPVEMNIKTSDVRDWRCCADRKGQFETVALPDACFHTLQDASTVPADVLSGLAAADKLAGDGHTLFVLRVGDASFSVLDVHKIHLASNATFHRRMLKWVMATSTMGVENKLIQAMNRSHESVYRTLLSLGCSPNTLQRLGPGNSNMNLRAMANTLRKQGLPVMLPQVIHSLLTNVEVGCSLAFLHHMNRRVPEDNAASMVCFQLALKEVSRPFAAALIQRNVRGMLSRKRTRVLNGVRQARRQREEAIAVTRRNRPEVLPKSDCVAHVVCLQEMHSPHFPPLIGADVAGIAAALKADGYAVTAHNNLAFGEFLGLMDELAPLQSMTLVYVVARGGVCYFPCPRHPYLDRFAILSDEMARRGAVEDTFINSLNGLRSEYSRASAVFEKKAAEAKAAAPPPKKGKKSAQEKGGGEAFVFGAEQERRLKQLGAVETVEGTVREREAAAMEAYMAKLTSQWATVIDVLKKWEKKFSGGLLTAFPSDASPDMRDTKNSIDVEAVMRSVFKLPKTPFGLQCMFAWELQSLTGMSSHCVVKSSNGHQMVIKNTTPGAMSWQMRKALEGHGSKLAYAEPQSVMQYLRKKLTAGAAEPPVVETNIDSTDDLPFITDVHVVHHKREPPVVDPNASDKPTIISRRNTTVITVGANHTVSVGSTESQSFVRTWLDDINPTDVSVGGLVRIFLEATPSPTVMAPEAVTSELIQNGSGVEVKQCKCYQMFVDVELDSDEKPKMFAVVNSIRQRCDDRSTNKMFFTDTATGAIRRATGMYHVVHVTGAATANAIKQVRKRLATAPQAGAFRMLNVHVDK